MDSKNLGKITDRAFNLIKEHPSLRDNFVQFLAVFWRNELSEEQHKDSAYSFLGKLYRNEVSNPGAISRVWRQLQQETPELRGSEWQKRQKNAKRDVPNMIKKNKKVIKDTINPSLFD
jgi:hypothetical protein